MLLGYFQFLKKISYFYFLICAQILSIDLKNPVKDVKKYRFLGHQCQIMANIEEKFRNRLFNGLYLSNISGLESFPARIKPIKLFSFQFLRDMLHCPFVFVVIILRGP